MSGILLARRAGGFKTSIALPSIGDAWLGGYYVGIIDTTKGNIIAADYYQTGARSALILAPISLQTTAAYKTTNDAAPTSSNTRWNGLDATIAMNSTSYPAAQYCCGLSYPSDGALPWYLAAMDEWELVYRNLKPTTGGNFAPSSNTTSTFPGGTQDMGYNPSSDPAGAAYTATSPGQTSVAIFQTGGAQALASSGIYRTATQYAAGQTWAQAPDNGQQQPQNNNRTTYYVRPVRRLVLT